MSSAMESISKFFQNRTVVVILGIALAVYVVMVAPQIPVEGAVVVKSNVFCLIVLCLIAYISTENVAIGILLALAFVMSTHHVDRKCQLKLMQEKYIETTSGGTPMHVDWAKESLAGGVELSTATEEDQVVQGFNRENESEQYAPADM